MRKSAFLMLLFTMNWGFSQIKKDSTFTVASEFQKNIKKYPLIKPALLVSSATVTEIHDIVYDITSGRPLHLDGFINTSGEKLPAILIIHGGGWKSGTKEMQNPMAEKLALNGYQVFTVEYRLSDEAKYPAGINDILKAIQFIKQNANKYKLKQNRIAILGMSSGAQMASLIAAKYPKTVNAVINIDGILAFHHPDSAEGKVAALWLGGTYEDIPEIWSDASALTHVSKKSPPFLFINSQFKRFSAGQKDFILKLNRYKIYSKVEKIENSLHTFWLFDPWFQSTLSYITQFLNLQFKKNK